MSEDVGAVSRDDFLGGKLSVMQPRKGYRAGIDPVLLAASVVARAGEHVLDLGCGVGVASLCLARRVAGVSVTGLELQGFYADLARENAQNNDLAFDVITGDLADMPADLRQMRFDHVMANPPYFDRAASTPARETGRETALGEVTALAIWVEVAARRVLPGGTVTFVHRANRLPDLIALMGRHLGSLEVLPLAPRRDKTARLVLIRGRKGGRADFRLHDSWVLHSGDAHDGDRENYTNSTSCVLRDGGALLFSG